MLQDKIILDELLKEGYKFIKKYHYTHLHDIIRYPTVGCIVELYTVNHFGCVRIDSVEGQKLIGKLCYF